MQALYDDEMEVVALDAWGDGGGGSGGSGGLNTKALASQGIMWGPKQATSVNWQGGSRSAPSEPKAERRKQVSNELGGWIGRQEQVVKQLQQLQEDGLEQLRQVLESKLDCQTQTLERLLVRYLAPQHREAHASAEATSGGNHQIATPQLPTSPGHNLLVFSHGTSDSSSRSNSKSSPGALVQQQCGEHPHATVEAVQALESDVETCEQLESCAVPPPVSQPTPPVNDAPELTAVVPVQRSASQKSADDRRAAYAGRPKKKASRSRHTMAEDKEGEGKKKSVRVAGSVRKEGSSVAWGVRESCEQGGRRRESHFGLGHFTGDLLAFAQEPRRRLSIVAGGRDSAASSKVSRASSKLKASASQNSNIFSGSFVSNGDSTEVLSKKSSKALAFSEKSMPVGHLFTSPEDPLEDKEIKVSKALAFSDKSTPVSHLFASSEDSAEDKETKVSKALAFSNKSPTVFSSTDDPDDDHAIDSVSQSCEARRGTNFAKPITKSVTVSMDLHVSESESEADDDSDSDDEDDDDEDSDGDVGPSSSEGRRMRKTRRFSAWEAELKAQNLGGTKADELAQLMSDRSMMVKNQPWVSKVVFHRYFDRIVALVLISNAILIGVQVDLDAESLEVVHRPLHRLADVIYCVFFIAEIIMRIIAYTPAEFFGSSTWYWNVFDLVVAVFQVAETVLNTLAIEEQKVKLSRVLILGRLARIARILRMVRIIRVMRFFRDFRILLTMIFGTMKNGAWALVVMFLIMYIFAIIFTQATTDYVTAHGEHEVLMFYYGRVPRAILTLFKSVIGGVDWEIVILPLSDVGWVYVVVFLVYMVALELVVMNVVTGMFLQSAIEQAQQDQEHVIQLRLGEKISFVKRLHELFLELDTSHDGSISLDEFEEHLRNDRMQALLQTFEIDNADAWTLFKLLDSDGGGSVDVEEFVDGCIRLKGNAKSLQMAQVMYHHKWIMDQLVDLADFLRPLSKCQHQILSKLEKLDSDHAEASLSLAPSFRKQGTMKKQKTKPMNFTATASDGDNSLNL